MVFMSNMMGWFFVVLSLFENSGSTSWAVCLVAANVWFAAAYVIIAINRR